MLLEYLERNSLQVRVMVRIRIRVRVRDKRCCWSIWEEILFRLEIR
jgi:hypothetical protein